MLVVSLWNKDSKNWPDVFVFPVWLVTEMKNPEVHLRLIFDAGEPIVVAGTALNIENTIFIFDMSEGDFVIRVEGILNVTLKISGM